MPVHVADAIDDLGHAAYLIVEAVRGAGLPPQEQAALHRLMERWQEATDALAAAAQALNGAENAAHLGPAFRRNYLAKAMGGEGFGGLY